MVSYCTLHQVRGIPTAPGAAVRGLRFPQEDGEPNMGAAPVPNMECGLRFPQEDGEPQPPEGDQPQPVVTEGWCSEIAPPSASSTEVREPTTGAVAGAEPGAVAGAEPGAVAGAWPRPRDPTDEELAGAVAGAEPGAVAGAWPRPRAPTDEELAVGQPVSPSSLHDWRSSKAAREETQGSPLQYVGAHRGRSPR